MINILNSKIQDIKEIWVRLPDYFIRRRRAHETYEAQLAAAPYYTAPFIAELRLAEVSPSEFPQQSPRTDQSPFEPVSP